MQTSLSSIADTDPLVPQPCRSRNMLVTWHPRTGTHTHTQPYPRHHAHNVYDDTGAQTHTHDTQRPTHVPTHPHTHKYTTYSTEQCTYAHSRTFTDTFGCASTHRHFTCTHMPTCTSSNTHTYTTMSEVLFKKYTSVLCFSLCDVHV